MTPPTLLALARAAAAGRPARLTYREGGPAVAHLEVELLSLGWRFGGWVALARDRRSGGLRVLPLDRVAAVRPLERRRAPRSQGHGGRPRPRAAPTPPAGVDPVEFALADLQASEAGPARRATVRLPAALGPVAAVLFAGAEVETDAAGARVRLRATDAAALAQMAASLGATVG